MRVAITVGIFGFAAALAGCNRTPQPTVKNLPAQQQTVASATPKPKPLSDLDLTKICNLAPKGRAQDLDYNNSEVINDLIANGKDSIPFLISKLEDRTLMPCNVEDYWPQMTVGDVAFIVLTDFSTDYAWEKATIPGTDWDQFFEAKYDRQMTGSDYYYQQIRRHGRPWVRARWQKIWDTYKDRIVWDEKERSFKVV
jgi:hypothetical protein